MTCLPGFLSGGSPCAALRSLFKSPRRRQHQQRRFTFKFPLLASAGLPASSSAAATNPRPSALSSPSPRRLSADASAELPSKAEGGGFRPSRVVVVAKTTRYEFEQQRYRFAGLSEEDLKQLVSR